MKNDTIYNAIRAHGGRVTRIRREIMQIFSQAGCLMSQADILARLKKTRISPNRSTLYRELLYLAKNSFIVKNTISSVDYYEISPDHHHLVCLKCNSIEKITIGNHLVKQAKRIAKLKKFNITNHSLDFYGYCRKCQA